MVILGLNYSAILRIGAAWFGPQAAHSPDDVFQWFAYISPYVELLEFILVPRHLASLLMRLVHFPVTRSEQRLGLIVTLMSIATIASLNNCADFLNSIHGWHGLFTRPACFVWLRAAYRRIDFLLCTIPQPDCVVFVVAEDRSLRRGKLFDIYAALSRH